MKTLDQSTTATHEGSAVEMMEGKTSNTNHKLLLDKLLFEVDDFDHYDSSDDDESSTGSCTSSSDDDEDEYEYEEEDEDHSVASNGGGGDSTNNGASLLSSGSHNECEGDDDDEDEEHLQDDNETTEIEVPLRKVPKKRCKVRSRRKAEKGSISYTDSASVSSHGDDIEEVDVRVQELSLQYIIFKRSKAATENQSSSS